MSAQGTCLLDYNFPVIAFCKAFLISYGNLCTYQVSCVQPPQKWLPSFSLDILAKEEVSGEGPGLSIGTGEVSLNERD